jgi:radical SAM protein with 4Fe4S-binding SPASM domain
VAGLEKPSHPYKVNRESENIILLARDLATSSPTWRSRPTEIEFSFNNLCNLKCIMCGKADDEPNARMDKALGVAFLDQVLTDALHLTPSANSEPFLNNMDLLHELCVKHNVTLFLFTNGMLCTEERFRKIQPRTHRLWFSFDSHEKETYEKIRVGADYETVVENMRRTVALAREDDTEITFHFVLMRLNLLHLPDYIRFVASLGGNQIKVQELLPNSSRYDELKLEGAFTDGEIAAVLERAREAADEQKLDLTLNLRKPFYAEVKNLPIRYKSKDPMASLRELYMASFQKIFPHFCNMSAHYLKVNPTGDVFPCCRAPEVLKMGNIAKASFEEIWNGGPYQRFREKMFNRDYEAVCRTCSILTGNPWYETC